MYSCCWKKAGKHLLMMIFSPLHSTNSHDTKRTGESSARALLRDITHHRTQPSKASLQNRGASQQATNNVCQARVLKAIAVPTSAVSRGQTSMTSWLSRRWTGIFQSAALCLCELLPAVPACAMNDTAGVWLNASCGLLASFTPCDRRPKCPTRSGRQYGQLVERVRQSTDSSSTEVSTSYIRFKRLLVCLAFVLFKLFIPHHGITTMPCHLRIQSLRVPWTIASSSPF
jgi:hypothetical protein